MKSRMDSGPLPNQRFAQQVADIAMPPLQGFLSGDITADDTDVPAGVARFDGAIVGFYVSVGGSGKDDTNTLDAEFDLKINGVSALSTLAKIEHVSGEASQQKTTFPEAGDTGVTAAVVDAATAEFSPGDVITWDFDITRTASPATEISNPCVIVELRPL